MQRLSLNPLRHIDWFGLTMMFLVGFGWAKPVPVDPRYFKNPKRGMAVTALAGPVSNFLLALILLLGLRLLWLYAPVTQAVDQWILFLLQTALLSIGLGVFNLIPIPPLDGSKVLFSLLPDSAYLKLMRYERYGALLLLLLVWSGILGKPFSHLIQTVFSWLFPIAEAAFHLVNG